MAFGRIGRRLNSNHIVYHGCVAERRLVPVRNLFLCETGSRTVVGCTVRYNAFACGEGTEDRSLRRRSLGKPHSAYQTIFF